MTLDRAPQYLKHFCSRYRTDAYTLGEPIYRYSVDANASFQGTVELPGGLEESLRCHQGKKSWSSERSARRDAALQAMIKLHTLGLVNDHLLPVPVIDAELSAEVSHTPSTRIVIPAQSNPWLGDHTPLSVDEVAVGGLQITLSRPGFDTLILYCISSAFCPRQASSGSFVDPKACSLYWGALDAWSATFEHVDLTEFVRSDYYNAARTATEILLSGATTRPVLGQTERPALLLVTSFDLETISSWINDNHGSTAAADAYNRPESYAIVRYDWDFRRPRIIREWPSPDVMISDVLPRRRNFLTENEQLHSRTKTNSRVSEGNGCNRELPHEQHSTIGATVDRLHVDSVCWSMILPSVIHHLTHEAIAFRLYEVVFHPLALPTNPLIREAITAPCAGILPNYQRLEFIGDSVLKFAVTLDLFLRYPLWHEGYLTVHRARCVSNARLAQVAMDKGIGRYIITAPFAARRWKAPCLSHAERSSDHGDRQLSSKVLADVIEAILGAVYAQSGLKDAFTMIGSLLSDFDTNACDASRLGQARPTVEPPYNATVIGTLEHMVGHDFRCPTLLIQAVTHPTACHITKVTSYQRLEYLGDAVLDLLITEKLAQHKSTLSHVQMHLIKSTLGNAHSLAFWCMSLAIECDDFSVVYWDETDSFEAVSHVRTVCLARCLRFQHEEIEPTLESCWSRFRSAQDDVTKALQSGASHPWTLLTSINAPKFVSDMVESILGAIFIDAEGDLRCCQRFLDLLGLTAYLDRLIVETVELRHPKTLLSMQIPSKIIYEICAPDHQRDSYHCTVHIDSKQQVTVKGGVSREHAITKAAEEGLKQV